VKFRCPKCKQRLRAGNEWVGKKVQCPKCGERVAVPDPPPGGPMVCPRCGYELVAGDKVCRRCGAFVSKEKKSLLRAPDVEPGARTTSVYPAAN